MGLMVIGILETMSPHNLTKHRAPNDHQSHQGKITMTLFLSENTKKIPYACYLYAHSITTGHFGVIIIFFTSEIASALVKLDLLVKIRSEMTKRRKF